MSDFTRKIGPDKARTDPSRAWTPKSPPRDPIRVFFDDSRQLSVSSPRGGDWRWQRISFGLECANQESSILIQASSGQGGRSRVIITHMACDMEGSVWLDATVLTENVPAAINAVLQTRCG